MKVLPVISIAVVISAICFSSLISAHACGAGCAAKGSEEGSASGSSASLETE